MFRMCCKKYNCGGLSVVYRLKVSTQCKHVLRYLWSIAKWRIKHYHKEGDVKERKKGGAEGREGDLSPPLCTTELRH